MKQRNDSKLDVFNPFLGLQPMLSPRSRTLPPIKRSSRDFRTSKFYPSRIPVRVPVPKEKQQRKMTFLNGEVSSGIGNAFPKFPSNFQQKNRLCARTRQCGDESLGKKQEKEPKKRYFLDENSETIHGVESLSFASYGVQRHFEKFHGENYKISQEKVENESELTLVKSSANSFDVQEEPAGIQNEWREKPKRQTRCTGRHLQQLQEKLLEYPAVKVREKRGNMNSSLSLDSPPSVIIDSYEGTGNFEIQNTNVLEHEKKVSTVRKAICRRHRTLETLDEKRTCPMKSLRMTQSVTERDTGIPCRPRLHKINILPSTPTKQL